MLRSDLVKFLANEGITPEVLVEQAEARFAPLWFEGYFNTLTPTISLEYKTILSQESLEAMATVGSRESEFPIHGRGKLEKLTGELPPIFVKRKMNADELRSFEMIISSNSLGLPERLNQVLAREVEDIIYTRNSVLRRLDFMAKQAVSTGSITLNVNNNPDGITFDVPIVLADNKKNANADWEDVDTDIIKDFEVMRNLSLVTGVPLAKALIHESKWFAILNNKSLQNFVKGFRNPGSNARYMMTLESVNEALTANMFPTFELVRDLARISTDGVKSVFTGGAWDKDNVVFVPSGDLGVIHNALADEQITPVSGIDYFNASNVLISRWRERKPTAEITTAEYNAFPGLQQAKNLFILNTKGA